MKHMANSKSAYQFCPGTVYQSQIHVETLGNFGVLYLFNQNYICYVYSGFYWPQQPVTQ